MADQDDDDMPTRTATFLESRALFLHQAALDLHERLERHASDLDPRTRRIPAPGSADASPTAVGEAETARVTAARAKMMAELFRQWMQEGVDPMQRETDMATWQRVKDAARSLGLVVA